MLRYVERESAVHRCLTILKMRGSAHDRTVREYSIGDDGMHVGGPLPGTSGILTDTLRGEAPPSLG